MALEGTDLLVVQKQSGAQWNALSVDYRSVSLS